MTEKEQGKVLIEKFYQQAPETFGTGKAMGYAIKCALITVDTILELAYFSVEGREYWTKVKEYLNTQD